jgi:hypothetical protein
MENSLPKPKFELLWLKKSKNTSEYLDGLLWKAMDAATAM